MQATSLYLRRGISALAALGLVLGAVGVKADPTQSQTDAFPLFDNYIKIGVHDASIYGNDAAFQAGTQQSKSGSVGIQDFHFAKDLDKTTAMVLDGRAMAVTDDYLAKLNLTKNDFGSFEMGYKTFRTYYDGVGGFFPTSNTWLPLNPQNLHVDRGQFWAEAKLNLPNMPVFTLRYSNETREGKKDSTIWGSSDLTGLSITNVPYTDYRKLVPSFIRLDERHETFEATMKHTVGKTTVLVSVMDEKVTNTDTRFVTNFPNEVVPWSIASLATASQPAAKALVSPLNWSNQAVTNQTDGIDGDTFTTRANVETVFSEKIKVSAAFSYQDVDNNFSGDRPIWTTTPTAPGNIVAWVNNNMNLMGTTTSKIYTGNVAVDLTPTKNVSLTLSLRGEDLYTKSAGTLTTVTASVNTTTGLMTNTLTNQQEYSRVKEKSWTPVMDFRYTGIPDVALYASATKRSADGDYYYAAPFTVNTSPAANVLNFEKPAEDHAYYNVGASWRQSNALTLRADVFYKDNTTKATGYDIYAADFYNLAMQYTGVKLTAIAKPLPTVTFTTRYVLQKGKAQVTGLQPTYPEYDAMDTTNHTIGETIDWTPNQQFYMQANVNVVFNVINTVYPNAGLAPAAGTTPAWDVNKVLQNSNNNNITGSLLAGTVLSKVDDLQIQFTYYRAANNDAYLAPTTMPYGVDSRETSVSAGVKHKFSDRLVGNCKVGYFESVNVMTGGLTNFHGPQAYVSIEYGL